MHRVGEDDQEADHLRQERNHGFLKDKPPAVIESTEEMIPAK